MNIEKYISRKSLYRALLFAVVILSAIVFDHYHSGTEQTAQAANQQPQSSEILISTPEYCVNPGNTFRLLSGADKLFSGLVFAGFRNDLLSAWHNYRSFYLLKAEDLQQSNPFLLAAHFMKFNSCHHSNPDDGAPAA